MIEGYEKDYGKKQLKGTELSGKRLGLIGFGRIAQGVTSVALAMGMECHAFDPYLPTNIAKKFDCTMHEDVDSLFRLCTHFHSLQSNRGNNIIWLIRGE